MSGTHGFPLACAYVPSFEVNQRKKRSTNPSVLSATHAPGGGGDNPQHIHTHPDISASHPDKDAIKFSFEKRRTERPRDCQNPLIFCPVRLFSLRRPERNILDAQAWVISAGLLMELYQLNIKRMDFSFAFDDD